MRQGFIDGLVEQGVLQNSLVRAAFSTIDRADFVPHEYRSEAYENYPLPIGAGQTISQPYTVAFMLDLLDPQKGDRIMDVGSGSGWTTALLAYIVGKRGKVSAFEIVQYLCAMGERNCEKYKFVSQGIAEFLCRDATNGLPERAPFDRILVSAAVQDARIPPAWKRQLKPGGRIVVPVLESIFVFDKIDEKRWMNEEHKGFSFVPFIPSQ